MIAGLLRPQVRWNAAQVIGIFTVMTIVPLTSGSSASTALVALLAVGLLTIAASYAYDMELGGLRRRVEALDSSQLRQVEDIRQRTRAISELTYTMSATLNYKKVLDAVIEAGRLGLRMPERQQSQLFAGVFLFHVDDNGCMSFHHADSRAATNCARFLARKGSSGRR